MKQKLSGKLAELFSLPQESFSRAPRITLSGDASVLVEGHYGLEEYGSERITAALAAGRVIVRGEKLQLASLGRHTMTVAGKIWAVELE